MVLISWIDYVMLGFAILLLVFLILLVGRFLHALLKGIKNPQGIKQVLRDRMLNLKTLVHVMVCFVLYTGVVISESASRYSKETVIKTGLPAPDFEVRDMSGDMVRLSDFRGRYVLLDFWFTGCWPCRKDTPHLKELHEKYGENLVIIGISIDSRRELVVEYVAQKGIKWLQILDAIDNGKKLNALYGVSYYPTYVFVDRDGKVARTGLGTEEYILENGPENARSWIENQVLKIYRGNLGAI